MRFRTHANLTQNPTVALILATVHHRLRLLAFPMRTASGCRTTMNLPRFWAYYLFRSLPRGKPQRCPEPSTTPLRSPVHDTHHAAHAPFSASNFFERQWRVTTDLCIASATVDARCSGGFSEY
jgi:hypothetical protein